MRDAKSTIMNIEAKQDRIDSESKSLETDGGKLDELQPGITEWKLCVTVEDVKLLRMDMVKENAELDQNESRVWHSENLEDVRLLEEKELNLRRATALKRLPNPDESKEKDATPEDPEVERRSEQTGPQDIWKTLESKGPSKRKSHDREETMGGQGTGDGLACSSSS